jgi:GDP-D-mannose 3', 5'-epimerase
MTIVITGASGFIGSHLAKHLEETSKERLILIDNFSRGKQEYLDYLGVKTICHNVDVRDDTSDIFFKNADTVYHTASRIGGEQFLHGSPEKELTALQENLFIDRNVLKSCVKHKVKKVIYTSSVSVYNTINQMMDNCIFKEEDLAYYRIDPEGGYGWAKFMAEKQLEMMNHMGIKVGVARIFKSYGPCDDYSAESGQVVCSLMRKAINYPNEPFIVWGDGTVVRCLVYIDDLIDGLMKLSSYIDNESLTVNFGSRKPYSVNLIAKGIIELSGKDIKLENDLSKTGGPVSRIPDLSLAKEKLNWEPVTSLSDGLNKTYEWMLYEMLKGKK